MPAPIASAAVIASLEAFLGMKLVEGSSNLIQGIDVLVNWSKAQEGLKYNNLVFDLPKANSTMDQSEKPATAAKPRKKNGPNSATMLPSAKDIVGSGMVLPILTIRTSGKLNLIHMNNELVFGVSLRFTDDDNYFGNGQVVLLKSNGFATNLGDQVELEFSGTQHGDVGYLLTFHGQINPLFDNNKRISGSIIVSKSGELKPAGFWEATTTDMISHDIPALDKWDKDNGYVIALY